MSRKKLVLKFEFQYWDPDECCRVTTNFEPLNDLEDKSFMILVVYEEVEDWSITTTPWR